MSDPRLLAGLALVVVCIVAALWDLTRTRFEDLPSNAICLYCTHPVIGHSAYGCEDCNMDVGPCEYREREA